MSRLTLNSVIRRSDEPIFAPVEDELVMISSDGMKYFHLNSIGASIWKRLGEPILVADLCEAMRERHDISLEQCRTDVFEFLQELESRSLLVFSE